MALDIVGRRYCMRFDGREGRKAGRGAGRRVRNPVTLTGDKDAG
jgi:hypothetical protein